MTREDAVARARGAIGRGCKYVLGAGGRRPESPFPWSGPPECDCSGFVSWCLGRDRYTREPWYKSYNGGWIETTAIVRDCSSPFGLFAAASLAEVAPGDLLVWGDWKDDMGKVHQGHVGIVTVASPTDSLRVTHCSKGNWRKTGDAIQETTAELWLDRRDFVVARYAEFYNDGPA